MANCICHYLKLKQTSTGCYKYTYKMSCAGKTEKKKRAESNGGGRREHTSIRWLPRNKATLSSAHGAGCKRLDDIHYHQPYYRSCETPQIFFNRKISDPGNIPSSLEERDELANGRLQR